MSTAETTSGKEKSLTYALELCDSRPSSFIQDGPGVDAPDSEFNGDKTTAISFPSYRIIKNVSRQKYLVPAKDGRPATFGYKKIRYIKDCPTIDFDEQERKGYKPNYMSDVIIFRNGHLTITNEGDLALFDYLTSCEYFTGTKDRPDDAQDIFKMLDPVRDAASEESMLDAETAVMNILAELKTKGSAAGSFKYNEDMLQFYCKLFKIPAFESGYESEAWVALARLAKDEPARFINTVASSKTLYESDVLGGIEFGVITLDGAKAYWTDGNKVITSFESVEDTIEEKTAQLINFMANPSNKTEYENLRVKLRTAKDKAVEVIK